MTDIPAPFAGRPDGEGPSPADTEAAQDLDLLSGLLRSVHLRGQEIFCLAPPPPFSISFANPGGRSTSSAKASLTWSSTASGIPFTMTRATWSCCPPAGPTWSGADDEWHPVL